MSEENKPSPPKKGHVLSYLVILFAAAFLLMLLSYFIQQRNNEETINSLQFSVSSLQSVDDLVSANEELYQQVIALQEKISALETQQVTLEDEIQDLSQLHDQLAAMDWLWRIQRAYSRGETEDCIAMVDAFEAAGLPAHLPATSPSGVEDVTPALQYTALLDALDYLHEA